MLYSKLSPIEKKIWHRIESLLQKRKDQNLLQLLLLISLLPNHADILALAVGALLNSNKSTEAVKKYFTARMQTNNWPPQNSSAEEYKNICSHLLLYLETQELRILAQKDTERANILAAPFRHAGFHSLQQRIIVYPGQINDDTFDRNDNTLNNLLTFFDKVLNDLLYGATFTESIFHSYIIMGELGYNVFESNSDRFNRVILGNSKDVLRSCIPNVSNEFLWSCLATTQKKNLYFVEYLSDNQIYAMFSGIKSIVSSGDSNQVQVTQACTIALAISDRLNAPQKTELVQLMLPLERAELRLEILGVLSSFAPQNDLIAEVNHYKITTSTNFTPNQHRLLAAVIHKMPGDYKTKIALELESPVLIFTRMRIQILAVLHLQLSADRNKKFFKIILNRFSKSEFSPYLKNFAQLEEDYQSASSKFAMHNSDRTDDFFGLWLLLKQLFLNASTPDRDEYVTIIKSHPLYSNNTGVMLIFLASVANLLSEQQRLEIFQAIVADAKDINKRGIISIANYMQALCAILPCIEDKCDKPFLLDIIEEFVPILGFFLPQASILGGRDFNHSSPALNSAAGNQNKISVLADIFCIFLEKILSTVKFSDEELQRLLRYLNQPHANSPQETRCILNFLDLSTLITLINTADEQSFNYSLGPVFDALIQEIKRISHKNTYEDEAFIIKQIELIIPSRRNKILDICKQHPELAFIDRKSANSILTNVHIVADKAPVMKVAISHLHDHFDVLKPDALLVLLQRLSKIMQGLFSQDIHHAVMSQALLDCFLKLKEPMHAGLIDFCKLFKAEIFKLLVLEVTRLKATSRVDALKLLDKLQPLFFVKDAQGLFGYLNQDQDYFAKFQALRENVRKISSNASHANTILPKFSSPPSLSASPSSTSSLKPTQIPEDFLCLISLEPMYKSPVTLPSGQTFERAGLIEWRQKSYGALECPKTRMNCTAFDEKNAPVNVTVKNLVLAFLEANPHLDPRKVQDTSFILLT